MVRETRGMAHASRAVLKAAFAVAVLVACAFGLAMHPLAYEDAFAAPAKDASAQSKDASVKPKDSAAKSKDASAQSKDGSAQAQDAEARTDAGQSGNAGNVANAGEADVAEYMEILEAVFPVTPQTEDVSNAVDTVKVKAMGKAEVTVESCVYTGEELKPKVKVVFDGEELKEGTDFKAVYSDNVNAGTGSVRIVGSGAFFGTVAQSFEIAQATFHGAEVSGVKAKYAYFGEPIEPEPVIKVGGRLLEKDKDYTLTHENNTEIGEAKLIVLGIGNYTGKMTATYEITPDNAKPVIDQPLMMVDVKHFNIADLTAAISTEESRYKPSDVVWSIDDTSIAKFWDYKDNLVTEMTGESVTVQGLAYGTTNITATLPNGKTATCSFRVMTSCKDSTVGSPYSWIHRDFYLVEGSWGTEYVEAYVNNAERMVKAHPSYANFEKDYPARTVHGYWQSDLSISWPEGSSKFVVSGHSHHWNKAKGNYFNEETVMEKPVGELSPNGWLLLQTSKNQWEYLLHKENGIWTVIDEREGSAGPHYEAFNGYMGAIFKSQWGLAATFGSNRQGQSLKSILLHSGGAQGHPSTHGCIALGGYSSKLYYDTFVLAGMCTRVIAY